MTGEINISSDVSKDTKALKKKKKQIMMV